MLTRTTIIAATVVFATTGAAVAGEAKGPTIMNDYQMGLIVGGWQYVDVAPAQTPFWWPGTLDNLPAPNGQEAAISTDAVNSGVNQSNTGESGVVLYYPPE